MSDEHLDSDHSEEISDDNINASPDMQSTVTSNDDHTENRRPSRDARTRAKVALVLDFTAYSNNHSLQVKIKQHVQKKVGRKG